MDFVGAEGDTVSWVYLTNEMFQFAWKDKHSLNSLTGWSVPQRS
jgi:hypothetical protein